MRPAAPRAARHGLRSVSVRVRPLPRLLGIVAAGGGAGVALSPGSLPAVGITAFAVLGFGMGIINTLIFALHWKG